MPQSTWAVLQCVPMLSLAACPRGTLPGNAGFEERLAMEVKLLGVFLGCPLIQLIARILFMFP